MLSPSASSVENHKQDARAAKSAKLLKKQPWMKPEKASLSGIAALAGLKSAFSKATWGINLAKAFAPKMELNARNRIKVGVRFRPLNDSEIKRGDQAKLTRGSGFLELEASTAQVTISNPRPSPGQEAKTDFYAFDQLYSPEHTTKKVFEDLVRARCAHRAAPWRRTSLRSTQHTAAALTPEASTAHRRR